MSLAAAVGGDHPRAHRRRLLRRGAGGRALPRFYGDLWRLQYPGHKSGSGDSESDRGAFLDQFFKQGKLDGNKLSFTTETVHGIWYDFKGTIERGDGKTLEDQSYYVLKGTLTEYRTDANKKVTSKSQQVILKSFPREA